MAKRKKSARSDKSQTDAGRDSSKGGLILRLATLMLVIGLVVYLLMTGFTGDDAASPRAASPSAETEGTNSAQQSDAGSPFAEELPPAPVTIDPAFVQFGEVPKNTMLTRQVTMRNDGSAPVRIIDTRPSCPCTTVERSANTINPGGSITMDIEMDSEARVGPKNVHINVIFAGYDRMRIPINATVVDGPA